MTATEREHATSHLPLIERASLHLYQLYDVGNSIDLDQARATLAVPTARVRPVASRGGSIDIAQLPLEVQLGDTDVQLASRWLHGQLYARIYDLGILALRIVLPLPSASWETITELIAGVQSYPAVTVEVFRQGCDALIERLGSAVERPSADLRMEDYAIVVVEQLGAGSPAATLARHPTLLQAALGERKPLSESAASLATALSYYEDDLIVLTWSAALIIEPDAPARDDATLLLEFANAQLLAFRSYDAEIERDLARITPRIARLRRPRWSLLGSSGRFLREIQALVADITDTSTRVENALKVTEDVYWNRVYSAALAILRVQVWRTSIAKSLDVLRQMASLLHDEAQAAWTTLLEVLVIVLITVELVVAVVGLRR